MTIWNMLLRYKARSIRCTGGLVSAARVQFGLTGKSDYIGERTTLRSMQRRFMKVSPSLASASMASSSMISHSCTETIPTCLQLPSLGSTIQHAQFLPMTIHTLAMGILLSTCFQVSFLAPGNYAHLPLLTYLLLYVSPPISSYHCGFLSPCQLGIQLVYN